MGGGPVPEEFAGSLDLKILFSVFGGFVVVEAMGILFPGEDLEVEAG